MRKKNIIQSVARGGNGRATDYLIDLSKGTRKPDYISKSHNRDNPSSDTTLSDDSHDTRMSDDSQSSDILSTNHPTFHAPSSDISALSSDIVMSSHTSSEPPLEPPLTTGESARSAAPVVGGGVVGDFSQRSQDKNSSGNASRHKRADVRAYLEDCQRQGQNIRSVDAIAAKLLKTGEADDAIQTFLDRLARTTLDTKECPDCGGSGFTYPNGMSISLVKKCLHERLVAQRRAS